MNGWSFVIVASGKGTRMGGEPKQFRELGGVPLWEWSYRVADRLAREGLVEECVLVLPEGRSGTVTEPPDGTVSFRTASGGPSRSDSVRKGIAAARCEWVMIHDAVRPFLPLRICYDLARRTDCSRGAVPLLPVNDALKRVGEDGRAEVVDRTALRCTQTPQSFHRLSLLEALEASGEPLRDEAEAWLRQGKGLAYVEGAPANFKITRKEDLRFAWQVLEGYAPAVRRTGIGFDVHPLVPERRLLLAGVEIPSPLGLSGHSDADIVAHTVADALLGAAGEPDIGTLFPAGTAAYKDADSMALLEEAAARIGERGWRVSWVDCVLSAQLPKLAAFVEPIRRSLEQRLRPQSRQTERTVNVKVKSGEHIGAVGRGEAMNCTAVATIERREWK
ncbi:MAG: 2-C-methyl-D-erythritol 2,4-cyclodiphosphate synthase [Synergistales bacterium]|nr:2-C-methyl-D-erythritol 2,4-cyclodiphosphate synthase [Synergistales bacterium]